MWILIVGVSLAVALWAYSRWRLSYWSALGVLSPPFFPFVGHTLKAMSGTKGGWIFNDVVYREHGGSTFCGLYELLTPVLMVGDPDLLKNILVKDFHHFVDRRDVKSKGDTILKDMLTRKTGEEWKALRAVVTPAFTSGKLKGMFPIVSDKADALVSFCLREAKRKPFLDMKDNFGRLTLDTIASCAFGIECNSIEDETAEFPKKVAALFKVNLKTILKYLCLRHAPRLATVLGLKMSTPELDYLTDVVVSAVQARVEGQERGDFLDLLLQTRTSQMDVNRLQEEEVLEEKDKKWTLMKYGLSDNMIVAQSVLFLIAGYDTTASTLAFSAFLLAKHPETQKRLHQEMKEIIAEEGCFTYQALMEAKYLDACIMETLRLYPPGPIIERRCTKNYRLPGTDLTIEAGTMVQCPVWSLHHDPRYWPEPEKFLPDRFLPENKHQHKSFTHLPFGVGPRNCIGMRFAQMEAKMALAKLVLATELVIPPGHHELQTTCRGVLRPRGGVQLILRPRQDM